MNIVCILPFTQVFVLEGYVLGLLAVSDNDLAVHRDRFLYFGGVNVLDGVRMDHIVLAFLTWRPTWIPDVLIRTVLANNPDSVSLSPAF